MKKIMCFMLCAMMQTAFAESANQLVDGKYVNFEKYIESLNNFSVVNHAGEKNVGSCRTLQQYKDNCVNGDNNSRRYISNGDLYNAFEYARSIKAVGVYLPPGVWNFNNAIIVPHGMTLKGSYDRPHNVTKDDLSVENSKMNWSNDNAKWDWKTETVSWERTHGTNIACFAGWNYDPNVPSQNDVNTCILLEGSATLDGVNVYYPQQEKPVPSKSFNPVKYPWTITCRNGGDFQYLPRCAIMNTTLVNSYAGIDLNGAGDHYIRGVNMTAFYKGIRMGGITSQGSIEDVNMHHQFSAYYYGLQYFTMPEGNLGHQNVEIRNVHKAYDRMDNYIFSHLIGMELGWIDWGWISNVFIFKAATGFYFTRTSDNFKSQNESCRNDENCTMARRLSSLDIQNSGCDLCKYALNVEEVNSGIGVNFSNCNLIGAITISDYNYGTLRMTNSYLEFNAAAPGYTTREGIRYYTTSHVKVGKHTTLQISNSEIHDFLTDLEGKWSGNTFDVRERGRLLVDNSTFVWSNTSNFNFGATNGMPAPHHLSLARYTIASLSNNLFRGYALVKEAHAQAHLHENGINVFDDTPYNPVDR